METVTQELYNPHAFIAVRRIDSNTKENTFPLYKATEIEEILNRVNILEQHLEVSNNQLSKIIDNLAMDKWYSDSVDKAEVLRDICEILEFKPTQTLNWTITATISGSTEINIDEVSDFDIRYHLADNLSIDSNDFTTEVDSWDVDYVDSQDWE